MIGTRIKEHVLTNNPSAVKDHFESDHVGDRIQIEWEIIHRHLQGYLKRRSLECTYIKNLGTDILNQRCATFYIFRPPFRRPKESRPHLICVQTTRSIANPLYISPLKLAFPDE